MIEKVTESLDFLNNHTELSLILQDLDPSLFQNITLGVLTIFIPFAIVFLTDILNSKEQEKSKFEKMVLSDEVLKTKKVFWLAVGGIIFFTFFSGKDVSNSEKLIAILGALVLVYFYWIPFSKMLRFSEGYKHEFEIPFLTKLRFSKLLRYKNKYKAEKMEQAWDSFWAEKIKTNERIFTNIFIDHINMAIQYKEFNLTVRIAQTYIDNIANRDKVSVGYDILPKVLEWNATLWDEYQVLVKTHVNEKKIQKLLSHKYFNILKKYSLTLYQKLNIKRERFWNWRYFESDFLKTIVTILLEDNHNQYQLFSILKTHIDEIESKLDASSNEKQKKQYWKYINNIFSQFCPTLFTESATSITMENVWEEHFPPEWKITNKNTRISRVILHETLKWIEDKVFQEKNEENLHKKLTPVLNGVFPNVHSSLFTAFLMLFFSNDIKSALMKKPNFYIRGLMVTTTISEEESQEDTNKRLSELMKIKETSQKEETVQIILKFFSTNWKILQINKEDLNKEEYTSWANSTTEQRQSIIRRVRIKKLERLRTEINSEETKNISQNSERKELYRIDFLKLVDLLLAEVQK